MNNSSIPQAIAAAQGGDKKAFEVIYTEYSKATYFLALKLLKKPQDAEDVTQDVFVTAFQKIAELREAQNFTAWLNRITVNKCTDALRKMSAFTAAGVEEQAEVEYIEETDDSLIPEASLDNAETARIIVEIIDSLPLPQRVCVYFRYYKSMSVREIAEQLAVQETTVRNRLALAREKIRKELEKREEKDGLKLYFGSPLILLPLLYQVAQNTEVPAQLFSRITSSLSISASAATASTTAVTTTASSVVSMKAIAGIIAALVAMGGITTAVILSNFGNSEEPVPEVIPAIAEAIDTPDITTTSQTITTTTTPPTATITTPATTIPFTETVSSTSPATETTPAVTTIAEVTTPAPPTATTPAVTTPTTTTPATTAATTTTTTTTTAATTTTPPAPTIINVAGTTWTGRGASDEIPVHEFSFSNDNRFYFLAHGNDTNGLWTATEGTYTQDGTTINLRFTRASVHIPFLGFTVDAINQTGTLHLDGDVLKFGEPYDSHPELTRGTASGIWSFN
jgi:RNA polymerase sigma-70 factor (ECF subfamily)